MASTSNAPLDPLQTLQAALAVQANSKEQAEILATLRAHLELYPGPIRVLVSTLINRNLVAAGDSLLKKWVIELFHFAVARSDLQLEVKTSMATQAIDTFAQLLDDPIPSNLKLVVQSITSIYPLLFRYLCSNQSNPSIWNTLTVCKARILDFVSGSHVPLGVKLCAIKFIQRTVLVQTRSAADPRLHSKNDTNLAFCPIDHSFMSVAKLEAEGQKMFETMMAMLWTNKSPDLLSALINSWAAVVKARPLFIPMILGALTRYTPATRLTGASHIKSIEKTIRIFLLHLSRVPSNLGFVPQINSILNAQASRMDKAAMEEKRRRLAPPSEKRSMSLEENQANSSKRVKLEPGPSSATEASPSSATATATATASSILSSFDFTTLPAPLITDLIVANLEAFTEARLTALVQSYRASRGLVIVAPPAWTSGPSNPPPHSQSLPTRPTTPPPPVKLEPEDPLKMDIDQDEMEFEPDRLNEELSGPLPPQPETPAEDKTNIPILDIETGEIILPPPRELQDADRLSLITKSISRISVGGDELNANTSVIMRRSSGTMDLWMLLLVRMITRSVAPSPDVSGEVPEEGGEEEEQRVTGFYEKQDQLRLVLSNYIMADFPARLRLAIIWMNEEWYNDSVRSTVDRNWRPNYETWLNQIVVGYQTLLDGKDQSFSRFLLDIPSVPSDVLGLLRDLCIDGESPERMQVGFKTLRGFIVQRPSLRSDALNVLLELTTHSEKNIRLAAINTVKAWVPNSPPMDGMIRDFALQMLKKLQSRTTRAPTVPQGQEDGEDVHMENGAGEPNSTEPNSITDTKNAESKSSAVEEDRATPDDLVQTPYLPDRIELPAEKGQVLQHLELVFALCVKAPEFLEAIFEAYAQMDTTVQEAIQELITALIRSLGSSHGKLLTLMRNCPQGSESLALRVLTIFTEHGRPSPQLVALVKSMMNERNLDARFLIPIIAELDKPDIMRHLPRIVSVLDGKPEPKNLVRSVFSSVVTTPPQTFGSVTSNLPRVRQSELLTPAELMVLLHESEKEIGLKSAIEAIAICFSMTDVFRSEILAVVMQQIMDEPVLPVLFLRTVIQAVTTYKSLVGFVSTTLLSRLITKKIWTNPPLWEGFIRCAKVIAPASFGALLQLPKDQLRELVDKQPSLKAGLRDFVTKKGANKSRVAGFLDIFGESEESAVSTPPPLPSGGDSPMAG